MDADILERSRENLELILNNEMRYTEQVRNSDVNCWLSLANTGSEASTDISQQNFDVEKYLSERAARLVYVRTKEPHIVARGSHQLVLDVGNGFVAKFASRIPASIVACAESTAAAVTGLQPIDRIWRALSHDFSPLVEQYDRIVDAALSNVGFLEIGMYRFPHVRETIDLLTSAGIAVPPVHLYRLAWNENRIEVSADIATVPWNADVEECRSIAEKFPSIMVMPDLREGGKYAVVDYDEKIARTLSNGEQLIEQYVSAFKQLLQFESNAVSRILRADCTLNGTAVAYRTGKFDWAIEDKLTGITLDPNLIKETPYEPCGPYFTYDYHSGDRKAKTAMQRMFLLQVPLNKQGDGRLLAADLDHAGVSN